MDELERQLSVIRDGVLPEWDAERSARVFAGVGQLQRRRAVQRAGMLAASAAVAAVAVVIAWPGAGDPPVASAPAPKAPAAVVAPSALTPAPVVAPVVADARRLQFADGSSVELFGERTEVEVVRDEPADVSLALVAGRARFDVVPRTARSFSVAAGAWRIAVVGTRFEVERGEGGVRVAVEHGRVRVSGPGGEHEIGAGESRWLDDAAPPDEARGQVRAKRPVEAVAREGESPSWRSLIQSGDHDGAYRLLQGGASVDNDPWALMDAADAARLSGHPDGAVGYLDRVVADHRVSPVAPLAAFTLGRIELDRLGRPHRAAEAFAAARTLAPEGSLAQDALAREVEAWSKAGDAAKAYQRAQEYVTAYPDGRRLTAVRRFGGLE